MRDSWWKGPAGEGWWDRPLWHRLALGVTLVVIGQVLAIGVLFIGQGA